MDDPKRVWDIAHNLQCDVEYLLEETSGQINPLPKHAVDMILKRVCGELQAIKKMIQGE